LNQASECLAGLEGREDLPEARILAETLTLRLGPRSGPSFRVSADDAQRIRRALPDMPLTRLLLAEAWHPLARDTRGQSLGGWESCLELATKYLALSDTPSPERRDALLLHTVARLMLAREPDGNGEGDASPGGQWLAGLRQAALRVRSTWPVRGP